MGKRAQWKTVQIDELRRDACRPNWVDEEIWNHIWAREDGRCLCCEDPIQVWSGTSPHHLLPREDGGKNTVDNLVLLCSRCHDRLEEAQEASLYVLNRPPRRQQLAGIFLKDGKEAETPPQPPGIDVYTKRHNATRIVSYGRARAGFLLRYALRHTCWNHVDWGDVERRLPVAKN